ncbi:MAG: hypothetical protein HON14_00345 [Rhodospirillaceae bacterium]|jgi:hypothetical protein|nr:hypothetical protein [Rhodospirillaceae bacterium]MBT4937551.1 hypothetical protein [Rhodospirillaceae bacterium]MBT5940238.1 hypothetical protein [Rhodospirillaceae bacterium]MBT7267279.1 hypothetical protein [Rhodospirillaceae bacterium]
MLKTNIKKLAQIVDLSEQELIELDAKIEAAIIAEIDIFQNRAERETILIRFLNPADLALYEPTYFEQFKTPTVHSFFIERAQQAIERIGGEVTIAYMESAYYETWLGVNDFDDSPNLRIAWARQQLRGLSN